MGRTVNEILLEKRSALVDGVPRGTQDGDLSGAPLREDATEIKAATKSRVSGVSVGTTEDGKVLLFKTSDFEEKEGGGGTLNGPFQDVSNISGKKGFYLASTDYDPSGMEKMGFSKEEEEKMLQAAKQVLGESMDLGEPGAGQILRKMRCAGS